MLWRTQSRDLWQAPCVTDSFGSGSQLHSDRGGTMAPKNTSVKPLLLNLTGLSAAALLSTASALAPNHLIALHESATIPPPVLQGSGRFYQVQYYVGPVSNRCFTPAFWCVLPFAAPIGASCYCGTPYGPVNGVVR